MKSATRNIIIEKYPYLENVDINLCIDKLVSALLKMDECETKEEANIFIENTIDHLTNEQYFSKFCSTLSKIDTTGLALSNSFRKSVYQQMKLKLSILNSFHKANYEKSPLKQTIQNGLQIFHNSPNNSILKF